MKLLSVAIPCYNSEEYMRHAVDTLLTGGEDMEILIVNDGSKDGTASIADEYADKYPTIVKALHQENGGHGQAVNTGLKNATGIYYKVVDSDDWVDVSALKKVLALLRTMVAEGNKLDMLVCNYVYENVYLKKRRVMDYRTAMPQDRIFSWQEIKRFKPSQYIIMHSVFYRTKLLKDCGLELPKHTFYVDNIFVYYPLPQVKTMYYLDVDFYRYFIGRADQSVNEDMMIKRIDQQIRVTKLMIEFYDLMKISEKNLREYMINYLSMMMTISTVFLLKSGTNENLKKRDELWEYLKKTHPALYKKIRSRLLGRSMSLSSKAARKIIILGYSISRRIYGFG